jgi:hypothetical protein
MGVTGDDGDRDAASARELVVEMASDAKAALAEAAEVDETVKGEWERFASEFLAPEETLLGSGALDTALEGHRGDIVASYDEYQTAKQDHEANMEHDRQLRRACFRNLEGVRDHRLTRPDVRYVSLALHAFLRGLRRSDARYEAGKTIFLRLRDAFGTMADGDTLELTVTPQQAHAMASAAVLIQFPSGTGAVLSEVDAFARAASAVISAGEADCINALSKQLAAGIKDEACEVYLDSVTAQLLREVLESAIGGGWTE